MEVPYISYCVEELVGKRRSHICNFTSGLLNRTVFLKPNRVTKYIEKDVCAQDASFPLSHDCRTICI